MNELSEEFPPVAAADWEAQVARDLKGRGSMALAWTIDDGIDGKPLYGSEDIATIEPRQVYSYNQWKICAEVSDTVQARYAVARGAAALYVRSAEVQEPALEGLEIIQAGSGSVAVAEGATPGAEIASALRHKTAEIVHVSIGSDYFVEIAKLRALRLLWPRVSEAPLRILACTTRRNQAIYDPYVNVLRTTTEAMSAIIGGCDLLVVRPFDEAYEHPIELSRRLAINTQLILREESRFSRIPDPAAGCWYLEWLTAELSQKAWDLFASGAPPRPAPRKPVFVGVNKYVDSSERALDRLRIEPDPHRDPWVFEKERLAAERKQGHAHE